MNLTRIFQKLRPLSLVCCSIGTRVAAWADGVDAMNLYLSVIRVRELERGVLSAECRDPSQGAILGAWLDAQVISERQKQF